MFFRDLFESCYSSLIRLPFNIVSWLISCFVVQIIYSIQYCSETSFMIMLLFVFACLICVFGAFWVYFWEIVFVFLFIAYVSKHCCRDWQREQRDREIRCLEKLLLNQVYDMISKLWVSFLVFSNFLVFRSNHLSKLNFIVWN